MGGKVIDQLLPEMSSLGVFVIFYPTTFFVVVEGGGFWWCGVPVAYVGAVDSLFMVCGGVGGG